MSAVVRFVPALAWAGLIFFLSHQPALPRVPFFDFPLGGKVSHLGVYAVLAWLLAWGDRAVHPLRLALWAGLATLYGLSDELHQTLVPGREASVGDWLADGLGALLGCAAYRGRRAGEVRHVPPGRSP